MDQNFTEAGKRAALEKVRNGYLGRLPEGIRTKIMDIHKIINAAVDELLDDSHYEDLKDSSWAMSCIDEFRTMPKDKSDIGAFQVFRKGKTFKCVIQLTGQFRNHQYGWIEELLHEFMCNIFQNVRPKIRKKFDVTLTNDGHTGNPFEGFSVTLPGKVSGEIWELLGDVKEKNAVMTEASHGKLKNSFRIVINPVNGHMIKIVFDLNPADVGLVGKLYNKDDPSSIAKGKEVAKNIRKTGHNDFTSKAMVLAIVDIDTGARLNEVYGVGLVGTGSNATGIRMIVPYEFRDEKLGEREAGDFSLYPRKTREAIAKKLNLSTTNAPHYKVGEREAVPSYKSTMLAYSANGIYWNEMLKKARGVRKAEPKSLEYYANKPVSAAFQEIQAEVNTLMPKIDDKSFMGEIVKSNIQKYLKKISSAIAANKGERWGQNVQDERYYRDFKDLLVYVDALRNYNESADVEFDEWILESTDEFDCFSEEFDYLILESVDGDGLTCGYKTLPKGLSSLVNETNSAIKRMIETQTSTDAFKALSDNPDELRSVLHHITGKDAPGVVGNATITLSPTGIYSGEVIVTPEFEKPLSNKLYSKLFKTIEKKLAGEFASKNPGKRLVLTGESNKQYFIITLDDDYAKKLYATIKKSKAYKEYVDINRECDDVFEEKASEEDYRIRKFMDKYKFNKAEGTITVDGIKYLLVFGKHLKAVPGFGPIITASSIVPAHSEIGNDEPIGVVMLQHDFFRIHNASQQDATLQHEIGHIRHQLDNHTLPTTPEFIKAREEVRNNMKKYLRPAQIRSFAKDTRGAGSHHNIGEIEADAYASARTSPNAMRRSLRRTYRAQRKNLPPMPTTNPLLKALEKQYKDGIAQNILPPDMTYADAVDNFRNRGYSQYVDNFKGPGKPKTKEQWWKDFVKDVPRDTSNAQGQLDYEYRSRAMKDPSLHMSPVYREAADNSSDVAEAKKTLRAVSQQLINDIQKDRKMTQYTANIYANVITKNLLGKWAGGFSRLSITLDDYQSFPTVEFKVPKMTLDFVSRFIQGRETLEGFLHRQSEIKMKISPRVFHTMKNPDDAFNFFKSAITYYDKKLGNAGQRLMAEAMRLNPGMKHLISTTKLSGIVTYPMQLLFIFDDVNMTAKDTFTLSADDIKTVSSFIRNISSHYAAPEKEKKKIIDDVQEMVKALREAASMDENIRELYYLPEAVADLFAGKYDQQMKEATTKWYEEQVDREGMQKWGQDLQYMREAFGVRKLKKIPMDTVAYIQIETECIKDANDKMMISSYCLGKIELVEWYIELLDVGSKKYIVPHNKPYLTSLRTQLLACFKKIMATPIPKTTDRPLIDIQYPKGYEG